MEKYIILADSALDMSEEMRNYCGLETYLPGHINFKGKDMTTPLDWSNISREEFYAAVGGRNMDVSTAPPSPEEYYQAFTKYVTEGYKVLSMSLSGSLSSTYGIACAAADRVRAEHPDATIYCLDTMRMSAAGGLLVFYARMLQAEGKSFDEVIAWVEEHKHCIHQMGPIDDLVVVARRGRISMGKAIMGNFAGVKPMGDCNRDGYVTVLTKVKGINTALDLTARYVEKVATDVEEQYIVIAHTNREAFALKLRELLAQRISPKHIFVTDVFSGAGTNIGPGMVGVYFLGDPISEELSAEKDAIQSLL